VFHEDSEGQQQQPQPQRQQRQRPPDIENAAGLAPLRGAWGAGAGAFCADKYATDADRRSAPQASSALGLTTLQDRR